MPSLAGITTKTRNRLALLIRGVKGVVTVSDAAKIWGVTNQQASVIMVHYTRNGWLARIRRGVYMTLPVEASSPEAITEDAWVVASNLFSPCYIGGWSALEHWEFTEQIFTSTRVITPKKRRQLKPEIKGNKFLIKVVYPSAFFGLQTVWRNNVKLQVSDPSRTIIDILNDPNLAGGLRPVTDALAKYFSSQYNNPLLLIEYGDKIGNRAIFKRLGFLLEYLKIGTEDLLAACKTRLSSGNAKLDPALDKSRLIRRWRLWVPDNWRL